MMKVLAIQIGRHFTDDITFTLKVGDIHPVIVLGDTYRIMKSTENSCFVGESYLEELYIELTKERFEKSKEYFEVIEEEEWS